MIDVSVSSLLPLPPPPLPPPVDGNHLVLHGGFFREEEGSTGVLRSELKVSVGLCVCAVGCAIGRASSGERV